MNQIDHIVYVDAKEDELGKLLSGSKRIIIRGATGRKLPYGRVQPGDRLFFIQNNGEGVVRAQASVTQVYNLRNSVKRNHAWWWTATRLNCN